MKVTLEAVAKQLNKIKRDGNYEDWRDVFQAIHNWGYNTDFTYDPITDVHRTSVEDYLARYIKDVIGQ